MHVVETQLSEFLGSYLMFRQLESSKQFISCFCENKIIYLFSTNSFFPDIVYLLVVVYCMQSTSGCVMWLQHLTKSLLLAFLQCLLSHYFASILFIAFLPSLLIPFNPLYIMLLSCNIQISWLSVWIQYHSSK